LWRVVEGCGRLWRVVEGCGIVVEGCGRLQNYKIKLINILSIYF
jgi:hypothetical protein